MGEIGEKIGRSIGFGIYEPLEEGKRMDLMLKFTDIFSRIIRFVDDVGIFDKTFINNDENKNLKIKEYLPLFRKNNLKMSYGLLSNDEDNINKKKEEKR